MPESAFSAQVCSVPTIHRMILRVASGSLSLFAGTEPGSFCPVLAFAMLGFCHEAVRSPFNCESNEPIEESHDNSRWKSTDTQNSRFATALYHVIYGETTDRYR